MEMVSSAVGSPFHLLSSPRGGAELAAYFAAQRDFAGEDGAFRVVSVDAVVEAAAEWARQMPAVRPTFAVRWSVDPMVLQALASLGTAFELADARDMAALDSLRGLDRADVTFDGPAFTRAQLRRLRDSGIATVHCAQPYELIKVKANYPEARVMLSVCAEVGAEGASELLGVATELGLCVDGIRLTESADAPRDFPLGIRVAHHLMSEGRVLGQPMSVLDLGSGFPEWAEGSATEDAFATVAADIRAAIQTHFVGFPGLALRASPSRFLTAAATSLCSNIVAKTTGGCGGLTYHINDGVFGSFGGKLVGRAPSGRPLGPGGDLLRASVRGPSADALDVVLDEQELPEMEAGDWILFPHMGACAAKSAVAPPPAFYIGTQLAWELVRADEAGDWTSDESESSSAFDSQSDTDF